MATRITLKQRIARILNRSDEVVAMLPVPLATTTIAGSTTTLRDTALARGTTATGRYDHRAVEITELVTNGPAIGEVAVVTNGGFDNADQLTLKPAFSNIVQTGTDYILWSRGVAPEMINQHINDQLRATYHPHLWIPSLVDDADFEEADLARWLAVGTPTTRDFVTTVPLLGERQLRLVSDATGEGAQTGIFSVVADEQLLVVCFIRVDLGGAQVLLRNVQGAATLDEVTVVGPPISSSAAYTEVRFTETVVADMFGAQIRFLSTVAVSGFFISPPVIVQSFAGRPHAIPSWLVNPRRQIEGAIYLRQGFSGVAADSFIALSAENSTAPIPQALRSDRWVTPGRIILQASAAGPIAFMCKRPFAELASDTESTNADEDYVAYGAVARLLHDKGDDGWRNYRDRAREIAVARGYGERRLVMEENPKVLVR